MRHHQLRWRVGEPFRERNILVGAALEHLQEDQVRIPGILDVMQQRLFDIPDVPRLKSIVRALFPVATTVILPLPEM